MLTISDKTINPAPHYITKSFNNEEKGNTRIEFEVTANNNITSDIVIARFRGLATMARVVLGINNEVRLIVTDRVGGILDSVALRTIKGTLRFSFEVTSPHTEFAESNLFVERIGGLSGSAYASGVNWNRENVLAVDLGQISSLQPYNISFDNINLTGDVPDPKWFSLKNYQGLRDSHKLTWIGASNIADVSTYTERTDLRNLARYDYALALVPTAAIWGLKETFDSLKFSKFQGSYSWGASLTFDQLSQQIFSTGTFIWGSDSTFNTLFDQYFSQNTGIWVWGSSATFNQFANDSFALATGVRWSLQ